MSWFHFSCHIISTSTSVIPCHIISRHVASSLPCKSVFLRLSPNTGPEQEPASTLLVDWMHCASPAIGALQQKPGAALKGSASRSERRVQARHGTKPVRATTVPASSPHPRCGASGAFTSIGPVKHSQPGPWPAVRILLPPCKSCKGTLRAQEGSDGQRLHALASKTD